MIYAGIDLGGTTIKAALVTEKGEIEVFNYERKHKNEYTKKEPHRKAQIVEIK